MDGLLRCSRYAFGPNRLHYCGPDANREMFAYLEHDASDPGLERILQAFRTMYPYLKLIAGSNGIRDPFDERVVEAYWIGNRLLDNIEMKTLYHHLIDGQEIKKRIGAKSFALVEEKIRQGAVPHHSFHVLDIWKRTGHLEREHTLESLDACRVSWGTVEVVDGPSITVETEPLVIRESKLALGAPICKTITRSLAAEADIDALKPGDLITLHWNVPCEVVTSQHVRALKHYTLRHLTLANQTL